MEQLQVVSRWFRMRNVERSWCYRGTWRMEWATLAELIGPWWHEWFPGCETLLVRKRKRSGGDREVDGVERRPSRHSALPYWGPDDVGQVGLPQCHSEEFSYPAEGEGKRLSDQANLGIEWNWRAPQPLAVVHRFVRGLMYVCMCMGWWGDEQLHYVHVCNEWESDEIHLQSDWSLSAASANKRQS